MTWLSSIIILRHVNDYVKWLLYIIIFIIMNFVPRHMIADKEFKNDLWDAFKLFIYKPWQHS